MLTAYTNLESLLLFQALRAEGIHSISFNRVSDQLKSIPLIREDPTYDSGRLSPDALRELYLSLLKEEVKQDIQRQQQQPHADTSLPSEHASPGSRKRKAASPSLPTVHEAAQHAHLIPRLVGRLYARYRDNIVLKVQHYESKYAECARQVQEIENGQWDEQLRRDSSVPRPSSVVPPQSPRPSPKPSSTAHTQPTIARQDPAPALPVNASPILPKQPESNASLVPKRYSQAKIEAVMNRGSEPQDSPTEQRRPSSNAKLPPLAELAPQSPRFGIPPQIPGQFAQPMQSMQPHVQAHGYHQSSPPTHQSPYAPHHAHPRQNSMPSPQLQQSLSRPSSSPRPILPPPPGMPLPAQSPGPHIQSPVQHQYATHITSHQHYQQHLPQQRAPPAGPPPPPGTYSVQPVPPHTPGYYPQQHFQDRRTSYQHPQTPNYAHQSPHIGQAPHLHTPIRPSGYIPQQFPIASQEHSRQVQQPQQLRSQQTPLQNHAPPPSTPHPPNVSLTGPRPVPQANRSMSVSDVISLLATPSRVKIRPLWKETHKPSPLAPSTEVPRPAIEPLSPMQKRRSPIRPADATHPNNDVRLAEELLHVEPASKIRTGKRKGNARDRSPSGRSVVSSIADESLRARTRSQSVSTAVEAHPDDRPASRDGVKMEPSTPADTMEEVHATPSETPASTIDTRKRRGTTQSQLQTTSKRKRQESPATSAKGHEPAPAPPPRSNVVLATRNFNKMSSALMNDINSHKHAAYFNGPVKDKDAPGYSDIVLQPQNLKSIKAAINAGTQAVRAATSAMESPLDAQTSASSGSIELERTADVVPPKAIVNGAQLEKELMRMFANAYMFNPGEDGMALSTKEFFADAEQKIAEWRGTERLVGTDEGEDSKGKRRKT